VKAPEISAMADPRTVTLAALASLGPSWDTVAGTLAAQAPFLAGVAAAAEENTPFEDGGPVHGTLSPYTVPTQNYISL